MYFASKYIIQDQIMEKISLITSICALIITILNILSMFQKGLENNDKTREDKYFNVLLVKYMNERNDEKTVMGFLKEYSMCIYENYIPPYIRVVYDADQDKLIKLFGNNSKDFKLVKKEELLHHALVVDYCNLYENDRKLIRNISRVADKFMYILYLLLFIDMAFGGLFFFILLMIEVIGKNYFGCVVFATLILVLTLITMITYREIDYNCDMYSINKKFINKKISSIEKEYNKMMKRNYLP